jgi:hypothetical protein
MNSYLQLVLVAGTTSVETWAKRVNAPFARWLNRRRGRHGPIFADRPRLLELPRARALDVIAYVHNSPVRAKS